MLCWKPWLAVCVLFLAAPLLAAEKPSESVEVKIVNVATGKVLAPQSDTGEEYAVMTLADDNNTPIRQWRLSKDEHGYKLLNASNEQSLDVAHASKEEEAIIIQWPEKSAESAAGSTEGVDNQRWLLDKLDLENPKPLRITSKFSALVLDVDDHNMVVQRAADENSKSQLWKIVNAHPPKYFKLVNSNTGWVLALESDSATAGGRAVLAKNVDGADKNYKDQQWKLVEDGDHFFRLVHRPSGLTLAVADNSKDEDHAITVAENKPGADSGDNQRWAWDGGPPEKYKLLRLKSKSSGLVLDVDDDGNIVQRRADDKAKSQLWLMTTVDE